MIKKGANDFSLTEVDWIKVRVVQGIDEGLDTKAAPPTASGQANTTGLDTHQVTGEVASLETNTQKLMRLQKSRNLVGGFESFEIYWDNHPQKRMDAPTKERFRLHVLETHRTISPRRSARLSWANGRKALNNSWLLRHSSVCLDYLASLCEAA